jgi:putative oxidoreductase
MKLLLEERTAPFDIIRTWAPRLIAAALFLFVGSNKFADRSPWIQIFQQIGFGQWFRYFTGVLQVGGALLVLIPRTFPVGILILACTMAGAMAAWIFFLGAPFNAMIPGALLLGLLFVGGERLIDLFSSSRRKK